MEGTEETRPVRALQALVRAAALTRGPYSAPFARVALFVRLVYRARRRVRGEEARRGGWLIRFILVLRLTCFERDSVMSAPQRDNRSGALCGDLDTRVSKWCCADIRQANVFTSQRRAVVGTMKRILPRPREVPITSDKDNIVSGLPVMEELSGSSVISIENRVPLPAGTTPGSLMYLDFIRTRAATLRLGLHSPPR